MTDRRPTKTEDPPCGAVVTLSVTGYFISGFHNLKQNKSSQLVAAIKGKKISILFYELETHDLNMLIRKCLPSLLLVTCAKLHQMLFSSD